MIGVAHLKELTQLCQSRVFLYLEVLYITFEVSVHITFEISEILQVSGKLSRHFLEVNKTLFCFSRPYEKLKRTSALGLYD